MSPMTVLLIYCTLIVLASLAGGFLPGLLQLTHTRMQILMSFVGGLMLGVAVLYMLPHALAELENIQHVTLSLLGGLLVMFFLIRIFHVHQHGAPDDPHVHEEHTHDPLVSSAEDCHLHQHRLSWIGLALGLGLHTILDGVALAASVMAGSHAETPGILLGIGAFAAIVLHKPLDALSITSVMRAGGWSSRTTLAVNTGFALMCPLGALAFYLGAGSELGSHQTLVGLALAAAAGIFLCIALADILPELRFHSHDRLKLSVALLLGVLLAYAVGQLEPHHSHGSHHHHPPAENVSPS
jgi:zinc and cadmium transporter